VNAPSAVRPWVRTIAGHGIGRSGTPAPPRLPAELEAELLSEVARQRVTGLALEAAVHGAVALSARARDDLYDRHERQLALDLRLEQLLGETADTLGRAGIAFRALKGPILAHALYARPELRSFGDVDILVSGPQFDEAVAALRELKFERRFLEPRPGFDARFSKGSCLERSDGMEIDLHRTLAPGPFGVRIARHDLLAGDAMQVQLGTRTIEGLSRELAFVHACFHAVLGNHPPRLVPLRDVAEFLSAGVDAGAVVNLVTAAKCEVVICRAVELLQSELGLAFDDEISEWARQQLLSRRERLSLRAYEQHGPAYAVQAAASLWALPSMHERCAYVRALALPSRDYLRARERAYGARIRRGVALARASRSR
jgi:hypothetical protein